VSEIDVVEVVARRVRIVLTTSGRAYADAVVNIVHSLNRELTERIAPEQLVAARAVLRAVVEAPSPSTASLGSTR
jgi:DNA-binding MarR family transcriptional regulator